MTESQSTYLKLLIGRNVPTHLCCCHRTPCRCRWCSCGAVAYGFCPHNPPIERTE